MMLKGIIVVVIYTMFIFHCKWITAEPKPDWTWPQPWKIFQSWGGSTPVAENLPSKGTEPIIPTDFVCFIDDCTIEDTPAEEPVVMAKNDEVTETPSGLINFVVAVMKNVYLCFTSGTSVAFQYFINHRYLPDNAKMRCPESSCRRVYYKTNKPILIKDSQQLGNMDRLCHLASCEMEEIPTEEQTVNARSDEFTDKQLGLIKIAGGYVKVFMVMVTNVGLDIFQFTKNHRFMASVLQLRCPESSCIQVPSKNPFDRYR